MLPPSTPTKAIKADNDINTRVQNLSLKWGLQIPVRDTSWSPSRSSNKSREQQIYAHVRFLYFKDESALDYAVAKFEEHAAKDWVAKPRADPDLLPSRSTRASTRQATFLKTRDNPSDSKATELRDLLLDLLSSTADNVRSGRPYKIETTQKAWFKSQGPPQETVYSPAKKLPRQATIADFFKRPIPGRSALGNVSPLKAHPSSDDFPEEDASLFTDLPMPDAPLKALGKESSSPDGLYKTPPQEHSAATLAKEDVHTFRKPKLESMSSRKRSHPDSTVSGMQRNVSREKRTSGYSRSHSANEIGPANYASATKLPNYNHPLHGLTREAGGAGLARSFSSASTGSIPSSYTRPSTGFNTPNTSFNAGSVSTSFDSYSETDDVTIKVPTDVEIPLHFDVEPVKESNGKSNEALRSTSEPPGSSIAKPNGHSLCAADQELTNAMVIDELTDNADDEDDNFEHVTSEPVHEPSIRIQGRKAETYLEQHLFTDSAFAIFEPNEECLVPFRQVYEVVRASRACNLPLEAYKNLLRQAHDDYESLWSALTLIAKQNDSTMPEKSNITAWNRATANYVCVGLSGGLDFSNRAGERLLNFNLKPLKMESSHRLSRKFGGDRFCVISLPAIEPNDLPKYLKGTYSVVRPALIKWLVDTDHHFLGRKWRAFYVKPESTKKSAANLQKKSSKSGYRIFFFAEDGQGFLQANSIGEPDPRRPNHRPLTVAKLLEWFMPAKENRDALCLKFFARLALAVSSTKPSVRFNPGEIVRSDDAYAHKPEPRRLNLRRSDDKKNHLHPANADKLTVMNDGCARISRIAAKHIAETLGLDTVPSVYQGRIGGAKGIWMIDALDESLPGTNRGYWIEITDSQLKFESDPMDNLFPDPERVTFEVQSYSKKLSTAALNFQLMPILADRGVPYGIFKRLLEEDLTAKVGELEVAMDSPLALRKWNQDNNSVTEERLGNKGIEMVGGIPDSLAEKINWFVEHGFEPKFCRTLKDYLYKSILDYCTRLENKMNIELGKSTYALMIADPLALLEENEVHIGFSSMFTDAKSEWSEIMLHNMDILVARLPALLPSDIQKVRAVFKPELGIYRDVIIFSSKGACSLAEKLSGGDFDGDRAWICWEPSIVEPFQNASMPEPVRLEEFGIEKDTLKVADTISPNDYPSRFLTHAFDFNLRANMLGSCTAYHEAMCYHEKSISDKRAVKIAVLLGLLVDRAKAGIIFDEPQWNAYRKRNQLNTYKKPAYKDRAGARPKDHLIDNLVFKVAKRVREDALGKFAKHFQDVGTQDEDLTRLWTLESDEAKRDDALRNVLHDLSHQLKRIHIFWKLNVQTMDNGNDIKIRKDSTISFRAMVERCRSDFLAIQPLAIEGNAVTKRWKREGAETSGRGYWDLLKASAAYNEWHRSGTFVWFVAGVELGELKATAAGKGSYRIVREDIFEAFKLDNKVVRRRREMESGRVFEQDDDEFGDFDWDDLEL